MASTPPALRSPVTASVAGELRRVEDRWRVLPIERAQRYAGRVRSLVQALADGVALAQGRPVSPVPDLGPAALLDQLTVLVYDTSEAGLDEGLTDHLVQLRRSLR